MVSTAENEIRTDFLGRKVIIAANRSKRPQDFIRKNEAHEKRDGPCYFCPGNEAMTPPEISRIEGKKKDFWLLRNFNNMFFALSKSYPRGYGVHEIIVETPTHSRFSSLPESAFYNMIELFLRRLHALSKDSKIKYAQFFKNDGLKAGASISHSHTQLIALPYIPKIVSRMEAASAGRRCSFCRMLETERARIIFENNTAIAFVPYAARFPYEIWVLPKRHAWGFSSMDNASLQGFARALKASLQKLDKLLKNPDYNIVYYSSLRKSGLHMHAEIIPRLTTLAGFEFGTETIINPVVPEQAAKSLRECKTLQGLLSLAGTTEGKLGPWIREEDRIDAKRDR